VKGFLWGTLTLAALQVVLQQGAANNISGGLTKANTALTWFLSPSKPLIRNYAAGKTSTGSTSTPGNNNATNVAGAGPAGATLSSQALGVSAIRSYAGGAVSTAPGAGH
jgi:hypothetical protein